jgi:oxygen-independent coproporphyrinogen-3 oxidase
MRHLYVHVPFCSRRCSYCDFSIAVRRRVPVDDFVDAVARELSISFSGQEHWVLDTLYLGGGTPSRLGGEGVARLLDRIRSRVSLADAAEVTIEANPEDVTADAVAAWRAGGVNRLSIGAQSFDDAVLTWMHRTHNAAAIPRAVDVARGAGIQNLSLDLIFALPAAIQRDWERDVALAVGLEPEHLSLYGLTIEPRTPFGRQQVRGDLTEAPEERYEREFLFAHAALTGAGFQHYEVSNFGRPGRRSRHNSAYWSGAAYAGVGPSAHEFDGTARRWNEAAYAAWLARVSADRDPIAGGELLTRDQHAAEAVYLGLRTIEGLRLNPSDRSRVDRWVDAGWALVTDDRAVLTPHGWLRLDGLAADLTVLRSR